MPGRLPRAAYTRAGIPSSLTTPAVTATASGTPMVDTISTDLHPTCCRFADMPAMAARQLSLAHPWAA